MSAGLWMRCANETATTRHGVLPWAEGVSEAVSQRQATGADTSQDGRCPPKKAGGATGPARAGVSRLSPQDMAGSRHRPSQHGLQGSASTAQLPGGGAEVSSWTSMSVHVLAGKPSQDTENGSTSLFLAAESTASAPCDGTLEAFNSRSPSASGCENTSGRNSLHSCVCRVTEVRKQRGPVITQTSFD